MTEKQRDIKRKLAVLEYADACGNVAKTCRYFGISRGLSSACSALRLPPTSL